MMRLLGLAWVLVIVADPALADDGKVLDVGKELKISGTLKKGTPQQVYRVNFEENATYVIDMVSPNPKDLDPFLRLLDAAGKALAADDDGGGDLNARILFAAPASGTYQIVATSYNGSGMGAFSLAVRRDDTRLAVALQAKVDFLYSEGKGAEAVAASRQLLDVQRRRHGPKHWITIDAQWQVRTMEKTALLSPQAKIELGEAGKLLAKAGQLEEQSKYAEAGALYLEVLDRQRKLLGEQHPYTATYCGYLAANLTAQGKHAEAEVWARKAVELRRQHLGEHPHTATSCVNLAFLLNQLGKYADAGAMYQEALALQQKLLGEEHSDTATTYLNMGANLSSQGKYAEAVILCQKALHLYRKLLGEEHLNTAACCGNLADAFYALDKYAEAGPLYQKALDRFRKSLGEEDSRTARWARSLANNFNAQHKYAEAGALYEKLLGRARKLHGEEHLDTADAYFNMASNSSAQGKYGEAAGAHRKALELRRKLLGEEHMDTAESYLSLGNCLNRQAKNVEAEVVIHKALDLYRKLLGEGHVRTGAVYAQLANTMRYQHRYVEAGALDQRTLEIFRKVLGEEHPDTAACYNNLACNLDFQGRYTEAEFLHRKALRLRRKLLGEEHLDTAESYRNLSLNLDEQGKYTEAAMIAQKNLDINRKVLGEEHPETARAYLKLALILRRQGKYGDAAGLAEHALELCRKLFGGEDLRTAESTHDLAYILEAQGKHAEAAALEQKTLDLRRKLLGEEHPDTAASYNNLGLNLQTQGKHAEATVMLQKALDLHRKFYGEEQWITAIGYHNLAGSLYTQGKYAEAEASWLSASRLFAIVRLRSSKAGFERATFAAKFPIMQSLAACQARNGKHLLAWQTLEAGLARGLLDEVSRSSLPISKEERRRQEELLAKLDQLDSRIIPLVTGGAPKNADSELAEALAQRRQAGQELTDLEALIAGRVVYKLSDIQRHIPTDAALVAWVDLGGDLKDKDPDGDHWGCVVRRSGTPVWLKLPGSGPRGEWTKEDDKAPGLLLDVLASPRGKTDEVQSAIRRLAEQRLKPLEPALRPSGELPAVKRLLVVPAWSMAGIPVEALTDRYTISYVPSGSVYARLMEKREQSPLAKGPMLLVGDPVLTFGEKSKLPPLPEHGVLLLTVQLDSNAQKSGLRGGDVLLRYGGKKLLRGDDLVAAVKESTSSAKVEVWREGKIESIEVAPGPLGVQFSLEPVPQTLLARREADLLLHPALHKSFPPLKGARAEIAALGQLFPQALTLTGSDASEAKLLALKADLKKYRYLHFAVHGYVDDQRAFNSALILARDRLPDPANARVDGMVLDGSLTAEEIATWKLDAELVVLSACQTALGKGGGGEGYLGFSQTLLLAGTRSLVVSLWEVDDASTSLLMRRFYENLLGKTGGVAIAKGAALREAQSWLRTLTAKEAAVELDSLPRGAVRTRQPSTSEPAFHPFAHPYYWAAFILIGDPG